MGGSGKIMICCNSKLFDRAGNVCILEEINIKCVITASRGDELRLLDVGNG